MTKFGMLGIFAGKFQVFARILSLRVSEFLRVQKKIVPVKARPDGEEAVHETIGEVFGVVFDFIIVVAAF